MQKWLIPSNIKTFDVVSHFEENELIDWIIHGKFKIGDIVYIYVADPIKKVMCKTIIENEVFYAESSEKGACLRLMKKVDVESLSYENLLKHGLKGPLMGPKKLDGELEEYIEKCFDEVCDGYKNNRLWFINAGKKGVLINEFKKHNIISIGKPLGDLTGKNKDEIKTLCQKSFNGDSEVAINQKAALINKFVNVIRVGDYILSHDTSKNIFYLGICTSNYYYGDIINSYGADEEYNHYRNVEWLSAIKYDSLSEDAKNSFPRKLTITELYDDVKKEFLDYRSKPFSSDKNRNIIYFGAPGTGKSHTLEIDKNILLNCYKNNYERVTFHPDYSYANFVGTYKPVPTKDKVTNELKISYEYVPGPFMRVLVNALKKPEEPFMLLIEEINRANAAAVFGDIFQLLDRDEKDHVSKYPIHASEDMKNYLEDELGEKFEEIKIPYNMFIWATMNSADQGVFPMDTAFKRRWDFKYFPLNPKDNEMEKIEIEVDEKWDLENNKLNWDELRREINSALSGYGINEDKLIGPYYAFTEYLKEEKLEFEDFKEIFKNKILMYLFDDAARSKRPKLFEGVEGDITYSQICDEFESRGIRIFCESIRNEFIVDNNE